MKPFSDADSVNSMYHFNFLYFLFINFAKRPGSLTEQAPLRGPEKRKKISNTTNKNNNTLETTTTKKKKRKCKNRIGEDIDKKSTTHQ